MTWLPGFINAIKLRRTQRREPDREPDMEPNEHRIVEGQCNGKTYWWVQYQRLSSGKWVTLCRCDTIEGARDCQARNGGPVGPYKVVQ